MKSILAEDMLINVYISPIDGKLYYFTPLFKCLIRSTLEEKWRATRSLVKFHLLYIYIWVINITKYKVEEGLAQRFI